MDKAKIKSVIEKKHKKNKSILLWWHRNGHKIMRVILWFVWIPLCLYERHSNIKKKNFIENPIKTKKWIDKVFPKMVAHYCNDEDAILIILGTDPDSYGDFSINDFTNKSIVGKQAKKYFELLTFEQREKMIVDYTIDGYEKMLLSCWQDWSKAEQQFGWDTNWNKDFCKAVVFYDSNRQIVNIK